MDLAAYWSFCALVATVISTGSALLARVLYAEWRKKLSEELIRKRVAYRAIVIWCIASLVSFFFALLAFVVTSVASIYPG